MTGDIKKIKILIVDEKPEMRLFMSEALDLLNENNQFRIIQAVDGMDALSKLKNEIFNLVITDLNLPRMNGIDLIDYIKQKIDPKERPEVMAISENITQEILQRLIEKGQKEVLLKPFEQKDFLQKVIIKIKPLLKAVVNS